ncbi:(S)-ureidoglycine aminohydrolase [Paenibacillus alvei]|uniref:(S)-ureidoglycine aminohydrolase n=1 Tax=Paenibacillus alvei TaxID=44250 RepID=A0ABT4GYF8_PAEAL|nr:(S)-ureidoglycine aminohydrolase [Paenibacillus alvei]MCY7487862.1 (S)-ureidoglycine aminohydrolase [Paenibacillus alvei]MCY9761593.1 (S)-ureidoglycine aminohydrolase [Paenibacillus alvei]MCY9767354.1 (S)-ureidoglycine aminohydrolase [Paenibacillus alvei]
MGYPQDLLASRSIIKRGNFALIPPEGLVKNVVPGFEQCDLTILASPRLGAKFVDYVVTMHEGGKNVQGFGEAGVETFVYCMEGRVKASADKQSFSLQEGGYLYCPPGVKLYLENEQVQDTKLFLYKQKYVPLDGSEHAPWVVSGNVHELEAMDYDNMTNVKLKDLLPTDLAFDMNFHILSFEPGGCHPFVETHYQEHGAIMLSGEGIYNLDNEWIPIKKGDYLYMGPYVPQATYAVGREPFAYLYSKDCNRDASL